jgi:hypothetical protein
MFTEMQASGAYTTRICMHLLLSLPTAQLVDQFKTLEHQSQFRKSCVN